MNLRHKRPARERFAIRTVRDGRVRIAGRTFRVSERFTPYDGRLDGLRLAFGRYYTGDTCEPFVSLWGTEGAYKCDLCPEDKCNDPDHWPGPHCIDGAFPWEWWNAEESS